VVNIVFNEALISFATAIIGIISLILSLRARYKLSEGTFKSYVSYYIGCLLLLVGFALWKTTQSIFQLTSFKYIYTEYAFIAFTFMVFALTSRKIFLMSKEFGFSEKTKKIKQILQQKKSGR